MSKQVQVGDWIFEVKMVRASKLGDDEQPYSAIANCNINGDSMYIDGLLTQEGQNFTRDDFQSFNDFCYTLGLKKCTYHRFQNGRSITKDVMINPPVETQNSQKENIVKLIK